MTDPPKVTPALTPAEWTVAHDVTRDTTLPVHLAPDGKLELPDAIYEYRVDGRERHQIAALALHGQTFGFTREDVALALMPDCCADGPSEAQRSLAARIEALLPPEGT